MRAIIYILHLAMAQLILPEGTELVVRLEKALSSEKATVGDEVPLTVVNALKIGSCTLIAQDAVVQGQIIVGKERTYFGRDGLLDIAVERVQAVDGSWIPLRHAPAKTSDMAASRSSAIRTTVGLIGYAPAAPVIRIFAKGKEVRIPKSARFRVYTDAEHRSAADCALSPKP